MGNIMIFPIVSDEKKPTYAFLCLSPYTNKKWQQTDQDHLLQIAPKVERILDQTVNPEDQTKMLEELRKQIKLADFVTENVGIPTLQDIMSELSKPGRDPREKFDFFEFDKNVHTMEDLRKGMRLPGIVTNITNFGAFVDIGVHQDGLVHVSQMADRYVKDPNDVLRLTQKVMVEVVDIDIPRKRIQLSMKGLHNKAGE